MKISIPKEIFEKETRIAITPEIAKKFIQIKACVEIEKGLGEPIFISDEEYKKNGVLINEKRESLLKEADIILRLKQPSIKEISILKKGAIYISFLNPFKEKTLIQELKKNNITSISMEMIPRTTITQKMDAISSQANLAGYAAVLIAAANYYKILPMMSTPSGTLFPAKIFIIGAGVAGLQAIATAKRLGAKVTAFDTRPVVEEQIKSLGANFLKITLGKTGQTKEGYAKELTEEQLQLQKEKMQKTCIDSDIIITTAQVFGKQAPLIIDKNIINKMKKGSLIIDMATETGGNVEGSKKDEIVEINGIKIIGYTNLAKIIAKDASELYANNLFSLINHFWNKEKQEFVLDLTNEILKSCVITHNQKIVNQKIKSLLEKGQ